MYLEGELLLLSIASLSDHRGRQVISQALVSATASVDPIFALHVRVSSMFH